MIIINIIGDVWSDDGYVLAETNRLSIRTSCLLNAFAWVF